MGAAEPARPHRHGNQESGAAFADQKVPVLHLPGATVVRAEHALLPQLAAESDGGSHQRQHGTGVLLLGSVGVTSPAGRLRY
jgi:hypothetical protein